MRGIGVRGISVSAARRHRAVTSFTNTSPSATATGCTATASGSLPCVSRQAPVRRSNTCLYMGEATVGTPPRSPTIPRESTAAPLNGSIWSVAKIRPSNVRNSAICRSPSSAAAPRSTSRSSTRQTRIQPCAAGPSAAPVELDVTAGVPASGVVCIRVMTAPPASCHR